MKKLLTYLCAVLLTVLPLCDAMAQTLDEWNRSCRNKTGRTATVYFDPSMEHVVAVIPGNTYARVAARNNEWAEIGFRTADGLSGTGFVHTSDLCSAVIYFTDEDGDKRGMQDLEYYDLYGNTPPEDLSSTQSGSTSSSGNSGSSSSSNKRASTPKKQPAETAPAVTHAPRTGKCTLRQKAARAPNPSASARRASSFPCWSTAADSARLAMTASVTRSSTRACMVSCMRSI